MVIAMPAVLKLVLKDWKQGQPQLIASIVKPWMKLKKNNLVGNADQLL